MNTKSSSVWPVILSCHKTFFKKIFFNFMVGLHQRKFASFTSVKSVFFGWSHTQYFLSRRWRLEIELGHLLKTSEFLFAFTEAFIFSLFKKIKLRIGYEVEEQELNIRELTSTFYTVVCFTALITSEQRCG